MLFRSRQKEGDYTFGDFNSEKQVYFSVLTSQKKFLDAFIKHMLRAESEDVRQQFIADALKTPTHAAAQFVADDCFQDFSDITIKAAKTVPFCHFIGEARKELALNWCKKNIPYSINHVFGNHMMFWLEHVKFNELLRNFLSPQN